MLVKHHFLHSLGDAGGVAHLSNPGALQTVQQGALAHIGEANNTCSKCEFEISTDSVAVSATY